MLESREFQLGVLVGIAAAFAVYIGFRVVGVILRPWAMAWAANVSVPVSWLIGMKLRGSPAELIVAAYIIDAKRGPRHSLAVIEATYMAAPNAYDTPSKLLAAADERDQS